MGLFQNLFKKEIKEYTWTGKLWDMHCHIIPDVDDGSKSMDMSIEMIKMEIEEGVTDIMLTPHYQVRRTNKNTIKQHYKRLKEEVEKLNLPINLYLGSELFYSVDLANELLEGNALTLAGTKYVLVEFMPEESYINIRQAVSSLANTGYKPILAHVERYGEVFDNLERIEELVSLGAKIQVNSNSFINKDTKKFLLKLLEANLIDMIGTDAHSTSWRKPQMKETINVVMNEGNYEDLFKFGERLR